MALVGPATRRRERRGPDGLGRDRQELGRIPLAARVARPAPRVDRPVGARCVPHVRDPGRVVASGARRVGPASLLRPSGPHLARRQPGSLHPRQGLERSGARGPGPTGGRRGLGLPGALPVARAAGVFALGYILGLLALFAPGGVGVREVVLIGLLTPALGGGGAVALSVASRILLTVTEVVAPLCALLVTRDVKEDVSVRT